MRRPRNKIASLPLELRLEVMQMLDDGETYEAIREELREHEVTPEAMPGDSAFLAYRQGEEYTGHKNELLSWKQRAEEKKIIAQALEVGGGVEGLVNIALYEATEKLLDALKSDAYDEANIAKIANALKGIKAVAISEADIKHKRETEQKAAELKTSLASKSADPAATQREIDRILGVAK